MNRRMWAVAALATILSVTTTTAVAQTPKAGGLQVPLTGTLNGTPATGTFTIKEFRAEGNAVKAFGIATLKYGSKTVVAAVSMPVNLPAASARASNATAGTALAQATPSAASCEILNLSLGPLDLDLLGLVIHLDEVNLDISAEPGAGNLLGNLLCAIANLLNGGLNIGGVLQQLVTALNQLIAIIG